MTENNQVVRNITLSDLNNGKLANLYGQQDAHLKQLAEHTGAEIHARGNQFQITGLNAVVKQAETMLRLLVKEAKKEANRDGVTPIELIDGDLRLQHWFAY